MFDLPPESPRLQYAKRLPLFSWERSGKEIAAQIVLSAVVWLSLPKPDAFHHIVVIVAALIITYLLIPVFEFGWRWVIAPHELQKEQNRLLEQHNLELRERLEESKKLEPIDPNAPFVTLYFPISDLLSSESRDHYIFVKNIGERPALDVQIADLTKQWGDATYTAKFPKIQLLEKGAPQAVTPTVYLNGECHPIFSMISRIWFGALLIGDDAHIDFGTAVKHGLTISYTDKGRERVNRLKIIGTYKVGIFVSVEDQT